MQNLPTIGIIGSGMIGAALMRLSTAAGYPVLISNTRGPESLRVLVRSTQGAARAVTVSEAQAEADLVVFAAPVAAYTSFGAHAFTGRTVIDTSNYYPDRFGPLEEIDASGVPSSLFLQQRWTHARVVKALNTMDFMRLEALAGAPEGLRTAVPLAGEFADAVEQAADYVARIGFEPLITGSLGDSWRFQPGTPLHVQAYMRADATIPDPARRFATAAAIPVSRETTLKLLNDATAPVNAPSDR